MSEKDPPAFQFYPKDFLADTLAIPVETRGVYITLLCYQWVNGSIPESPHAIARICSLTSDDITEHMAHLDDKFVENPEYKGTRVNPRMERERKKQRKFRASRAKAGRASGKSRSNKKRTQSNSSSSSSSSEQEVSPSETSNREHPFGDDLLGDADVNKTPLCPHQKIVDLYHEIFPEKPEVRVLNEKRKKHLRARWREDPKRQRLEWWRKYFEHIRTVQFLMDGGKTDWPGADFDFMINATKIVKIIEGSYER